jgi:hypothetical protein
MTFYENDQVDKDVDFALDTPIFLVIVQNADVNRRTFIIEIMEIWPL